MSTLLCIGVYAVTAPSRFSPLHSLGIGFLFAVSIAVTRVCLVEHQWQVTAGNTCPWLTCTANLDALVLVHTLCAFQMVAAICWSSRHFEDAEQYPEEPCYDLGALFGI